MLKEMIEALKKAQSAGGGGGNGGGSQNPCDKGIPGRVSCGIPKH